MQTIAINKDLEEQGPSIGIGNGNDNISAVAALMANTGSQALAAILATSSEAAHSAQAISFGMRNGIQLSSDSAVLEESYFQGASPGLANSPIDVSKLKDYAGTNTKITLPGGGVFDTNSLGRDNGGNRKRNNRLMGPPVSRTPPASAAAAPSVARAQPAAATSVARAATSPFTTEPLSTIGTYGRGSSGGGKTLGTYGRGSTGGNYRPHPHNYRPHNIPQSVTALKTFAKVNNVMHGYADGSNGHGVKMPSAASQAQADQRQHQQQADRQRQQQELIEIDDESSMTSDNQHPETLKNSSYETPRTALINGLANEMIRRTAAPVLNVDSESVGTPDSCFGKDVMHYFGIGDDIKKNVAHVVLENKPNASAQDLMDVLNTMVPFPSMEKNKNKKRKSEKVHLEKRTTYGKGK